MLAALVVVVAPSCLYQKKGWYNRQMQNLTAHYNILFNAKEIIRLKQEDFAAAFQDNYNEVLNVYPDTTVAKLKTPDKDLESVILKANTIVNRKDQSRYIGEAYLIMAQAYFLEENYFNSAEYCGYVVRSFPQDTSLVQKALTWKARSLMYLNQMQQAKLAIDSALKSVNYKKSVLPEIFATKLQYDINAQDYQDGEEMAKKAIQYCNLERLKFRWIFILGQLQELDQNPKEAYKNYTTIIRSNAPFEMDFNASLNRIRINENEKSLKISKTDQLLALLKDPNNKEFKDQIYYQVAEIKKDSGKIDAAIKNYKLSVRYNQKNRNQRGLSYLRLAEVYFKNKADYKKSKNYYDSTLAALPASHRGFEAIKKRSDNLNLLVTQLEIITRQDTLQALARMDEKKRLAVIDKMVKDKMDAEAALPPNTSPYGDEVTFNATEGSVSNRAPASNFYFYNTIAVSQGFTDFKQKWGNRKLEDDWRRSSRAATDIANITPTLTAANNAMADLKQAEALRNKLLADNLRTELLIALPLTPDAISLSNAAIYNAYFDLANIYRDVMNDGDEAIATFKIILKRFPDNANKPVIYYSLYRLYSDMGSDEAKYYKNKLLTGYPETPFAGIILDPDYIKKQNDHDADLTAAYNVIFDLYASGRYNDVAECVPEILKQYPANKYSAQLSYLKAISEGHGEKLSVFADSLRNILKKFPNDKLIDPLIDQHLQYIDAHQNQMMAQNFALETDSLEVPFALSPDLKKEANFRKKVDLYSMFVQPGDKSLNGYAVKQVGDLQYRVDPKDVKPADKPKKSAAPISRLFNTLDSTHYFFVIRVNSGTTILSSSRFGVGEFDRAHYAGMGIKHQLMDVGDDVQLIYVGLFTSFEMAKKYANGITPLLPDIMKVPKDLYSFFIITQENLNKLANKKTLDDYIDYYQKAYAP